MSQKSKRTQLTWQGGMAFTVEQDGHSFLIDAAEDNDGKDQGPRPKALLLSSLAGCTGMDVVSILKKMKITGFTFSLQVDAGMTEKHPKIFKDVVLWYRFEGKDLPLERIRRAVELSENTYCGVSEMLRKAMTISTKIVVNGEEI
ncbi:MAG: OsmC family protein [Candidatus Cloacimonetes bacterium]|nr:OsmC family protein [Candidatus Cloacimonadota bacterium]